MYGQNPYLYQNMYQPPQKYEVVKVNGKNGADAFQMAPNSSVLLLDESEPIVWLKTTDGAGYPTVTPYEIRVKQPEKPVDLRNLEERIARIEGMINEQSNTRGDKCQKDDASESRAD